MCIPFGVQTISRSRTLIIIFPDCMTTWSLAFWLIPVIPVIPVLCCFVVPRNFPADRIEAAIFKLRLQRMRGCLPTLVQKNCRHWCSEHFGNFSVEQSFQKEKHIQTFKIWKSTPDSIETKLKARSRLGSWNVVPGTAVPGIRAEVSCQSFAFKPLIFKANLQSSISDYERNPQTSDSSLVKTSTSKAQQVMLNKPVLHLTLWK